MGGKQLTDPFDTITDDEMCQIQLGKEYSNISLDSQLNDFSQGSPSYLCCGKDKEEKARIVSIQGYKFYQHKNIHKTKDRY